VLGWKSGGVATGSCGTAIPTAEGLVGVDFNRGGPWNFYFHEYTELGSASGANSPGSPGMHRRRTAQDE